MTSGRLQVLATSNFRDWHTVVGEVYLGARCRRQRWTVTASLYCTHWGITSQCRSSCISRDRPRSYFQVVLTAMNTHLPRPESQENLAQQTSASSEMLRCHVSEHANQQNTAYMQLVLCSDYMLTDETFSVSSGTLNIPSIHDPNTFVLSS